MTKNIISDLFEQDGTPLSLSMLFRQYPEVLSGLFSDSVLDTISEGGASVLDEHSLRILNRELLFRSGRESSWRLAPLALESPFCFPVPLKIKDTLNGTCRPAVIALFHIRAIADNSILGRERFSYAAVRAIELADNLVPGTDRPWVTPRWPGLVGETDQASCQLAFFFASMFYLLGVPYPHQMVCSGRLEKGRFAPVNGVASKVQVAAQDGFKYFIVCGSENREQAELALKKLPPAKRTMRIIELTEGQSPQEHFHAATEQLIEKGAALSANNLRSIVDFLFSRVKQASPRAPISALEGVKRLERLLDWLPPPGDDEDSDSIRLELLARKGKISTRCRHFDLAQGAFSDLRKLCNKLLHKKRCPANFEDFWFGIPLYQGRIAKDRYEYAKAEKLLTLAAETADSHWPPNRRFHALCRQSLARVYAHKGQINSEQAQKALETFTSIHRQLNPADRFKNHRYIGEAQLLLGKFNQARNRFEKSIQGRHEVKDAARAALVRGLTLEGLVKGNGKICRNAISQGDVFFDQANGYCTPLWRQVARTYSALARIQAESVENGIHALSFASDAGKKLKGYNPWENPAVILADLCLCWLGQVYEDQSIFNKGFDHLLMYEKTALTGQIKKQFGARINKLAKSGKKERIKTLKEMMCRIHYGFPASFFDAGTAFFPHKI